MGLLVVAGLLVGLLVLAAAVGSFVPRDHVARVAIELDSPPERVWALVSDLPASPRWRRDVTEVKVTGERPLRFVEKSKNGDVPYEVVSQEAPRRQVVRVVDEGQPFGGTWAWEIEPLGQGARLTITEAGFIKNPIFRLMGKLFFRPTDTIEGYLRDLARELHDEAVPRAVAAS